MAKKYPVGTKIRWVGGCNWDFSNKIGRIVGFENGLPLIFFSVSKWTSIYSTEKVPVTIQCNWDEIEKVVTKGQQLLFSFMDE